MTREEPVADLGQEEGSSDSCGGRYVRAMGAVCEGHGRRSIDVHGPRRERAAERRRLCYCTMMLADVPFNEELRPLDGSRKSRIPALHPSWSDRVGRGIMAQPLEVRV